MSTREFESTIKTDFKERMDYGGYLYLDQILNSQHPKSNPPHHDEMLFIIQHQTSELWMKLIVHELQAAIKHIQEDELSPCFKILARVKHTQRMLFEQWAVLETLTPSEYIEFREDLGNASGFQSYLFRTIEFLLGNKDASAVQVFKHREDVYRMVTSALENPSIYDEFLIYLSRHGHKIPEHRLKRDWLKPVESCPEVQKAFQNIYEVSQDNWDAYEMCEKLIDVEEQFLLWRYRHMLTVHRIIGLKTGTGGSSGVNFLKKALDTRLFPELWDVRTELRKR